MTELEMCRAYHDLRNQGYTVQENLTLAKAGKSVGYYALRVITDDNGSNIPRRISTDVGSVSDAIMFARGFVSAQSTND